MSTTKVFLVSWGGTNSFGRSTCSDRLPYRITTAVLAGALIRPVGLRVERPGPTTPRGGAGAGQCRSRGAGQRGISSDATVSIFLSFVSNRRRRRDYVSSRAPGPISLRAAPPTSRAKARRFFYVPPPRALVSVRSPARRALGERCRPRLFSRADTCGPPWACPAPARVVLYLGHLRPRPRTRGLCPYGVIRPLGSPFSTGY